MLWSKVITKKNNSKYSKMKINRKIFVELLPCIDTTVHTCNSILKPASDDRQSWPTFWAWFSFQRQSADEIVEP